MKNFFVIILLILVGCEKKPGNPPVSPEVDLIQSGDIVIANNMSDVILLLDGSGNFKKVLYNVQNTSETVWGLSWDSDNREILATIDGADRVIGISKNNGSVRSILADSNLSGTPLRGVLKISGGDYLVAEDSSIERFSSLGTRISNSWPRSLLAGNSQLSLLSEGGFLLCSGNTSRTVAKYNSSGTLVSSRVFAGFDVTGCIELLDGTIAINLNHTTNSNDRVEIYAADLSGSPIMSYADNTNLANPTGLAQRSNGNLIVSDTALHHLIEITPDGQLVGILNDSLTQSPIQIIVIP